MRPRLVKPSASNDEVVSRRPRLTDGGLYYEMAEPFMKEYISSGCQLLDCALGGGWPLGRISNVVGDKSTGKTLIAIEAAANFMKTFIMGEVYYVEAEAAFDLKYARSLGMNVDKVHFVDAIYTVEDVFEHLSKVLRGLTRDKDREYVPVLYIIDSLDALSDAAELKRGIDEGSYGASKARKLSELFRRIVQELERKRVHLMIISQIRDNIGVMFGKKYSRSGGRALDFYASQIVYLAQLGQIKRTINKVTRTIGIRVKAKTEKNKIAMPMREVEFPIKFGFGIDDIAANCEWLEDIGRITEVKGFKGNLNSILKGLEDADDDEYRTVKYRLAKKVKECWQDVEAGFAPKRVKYSNGED